MQREKYLSTPVKMVEEEKEQEEFRKRMSTPITLITLDNQQSTRQEQARAIDTEPRAIAAQDRSANFGNNNYSNATIQEEDIRQDVVQSQDVENQSLKDPVIIQPNSPSPSTQPVELFKPSTWKRKHNLLFASIISVALVVGAALALFIVLLGSSGSSKSIGGGNPPPSTLDPFKRDYMTEEFVVLPKGSSPSGIRINKDGEIFVFLFGGNKVLKIVGDKYEDFAGSGSMGRENGVGLQASFMTPGSAVIGTNNYIFLSGNSIFDTRCIWKSTEDD
jgi:hypothetical protein